MPSSHKTKLIRPFLKWPGGKFKLLPHIIDRLQDTGALAEPFAGSGAVFLNTNYDAYTIADINPDLINLFKSIQNHGQEFLDYSKQYFTTKYNTEAKYYSLRKKFNRTNDIELKSALFLYLNRHGYNGLCRYNQGAGEFNVPFGRYKKPYFPELEMKHFHNKSKRAKFICSSYEKVMTKLKSGFSVYADPPYVPLNNTSYFTQYHKNSFGEVEQQRLATLASSLAKQGIPCMISNHSTTYTKKLYKDAKIYEFLTRRYISCKERKKVKELLAIYTSN